MIFDIDNIVQVELCQCTNNIMAISYYCYCYTTAGGNKTSVVGSSSVGGNVGDSGVGRPQEGSRVAPSVYGQSGKYAQALFNTAKKRGGNTLTSLLNELNTFYKAYNVNVSIQQGLDNPVLSGDKKSSLVKQLAPKLKLSELSTQFISVLTGKGHVGLLKEILNDYERLVAFERNEVRATVISSEQLNDEQKRRITDALKKRVSGNQSLHVTERVDPKILGGLVVTIDDKSVDLSVSTQIRKIETALKRQ